MIQTEPVQTEPTKVYRGTWDELMRRRDEFAPDAVLEMKVLTPVVSEKNAAAIALLQSWIEEDATDDPEKLRRADAEIAELMDNLNQNRLDSGERPLFSE